MNFLAPGAFFLGLLLPVIVTFYLLKLRRIEQAVPSVYLWRRMVRDVEANAPWQKLRYNLLMILQLLFLALLILALARPFTPTEGASGQAAILILDTSASMSASDMAPTRLEAARQRARQLIDDLPDTARVTIIEAGREAQVRLSASLDRRQAHLAIESIQPGTGSSDLGVALELASAIAARQPGTEIIVLSDGRVTLPERMTIKGRLRFLPFGLNGNNQAISLLNLEPDAGGSGLTAFVQVSNYAAGPASRRLQLFADGLLFSVYDLSAIPPGGQQAVLAEGLPYNTRLVEARLEAAGGSPGDILALDDRALAVQRAAEPLRVALVSPGSLYLRTALSLLPGIDLLEIDPQPPPVAVESTPSATAQPTQTSAAAPPVQLPEAGLYVLDGVVPETLPDSGSLLFIGPPRSSPFFTTTGVFQNPTPRILDPEDPLLSSLAFDEVSIFESIEIPLPGWALPVIAGDRGKPGDSDYGSTHLLMRGVTGGRRVAILSFALYNSDLPLNIAFPLLVANLVDWLAPGAANPVPAALAAGESLSLTAPEGVQAASVTRPDGSTARLEAENGRFVFTDTTQFGLYEVRWQGASAEQAIPFTVNLFSPQESNLEPAAALPGLESTAGTNGSLAQAGQREWWRPLGFLALGVLVGEWLVYQRAALARLRDLLLRWLLPVRTARSRR